MFKRKIFLGGNKMRKLLSTILASLLSLILIFLFLSSKTDATQKKYIPQDEYVPDEVLVKFKKNVGKGFIRNVIKLVQGKVITFQKKEISPSKWDPDRFSLRSFRLDPDLFHIKVPRTIGTERAIHLLSLIPHVEYAEENGLVYFEETTPNDDYYMEGKQWGLQKIDCPNAWDISTGNPEIVVAVIDTGVDYYHDDLKANIWTNEDEIPGNGKDDDHNGYIDDIHGYDFANDYPNPLDFDGHGTHVAGIIAAVGNNGEGVAGVNWNLKIMVLKIDAGDVATAVNAVDYATENGAHLSNNSWRVKKYYSSLNYAIARARDWQSGSGGKLFVASAGNAGEDTDENPHYPSGYNLDNIIAVCATNLNDDLWTESNYGRETVDLGAPGVSILSTVPGTYDYNTGTSMAAPHVAGVAALLWSRCPLLKWQTAKNRIMNKIDPLNSLFHKTVSNGRVNARKSIYDPYPPSAPPSNLVGNPTAWTQINLAWQDNSNNEAGFEVQRKKSGQTQFSTIGSSRDNLVSYRDKTATAGNVHSYKVRAFNFNGNSDFSYTIEVTIPTNKPFAPSGLSGICGAQEVLLRWHDQSNNEEYFIIERRFGWDPWEEIGMAGPNATIYYDRNLPYADILYYRVRAYNPAGYSSYSNTAQVLVPWY